MALGESFRAPGLCGQWTEFWGKHWKDFALRFSSCQWQYFLWNHVWCWEYWNACPYLHLHAKRVKWGFLSVSVSFLSLLVGLKENNFILKCFIFFSVWCVWILRITFVSCHPVCFLDRLPILDNEMFQSVKPGLSAYADTPEKVSKPFVCWTSHVDFFYYDVLVKSTFQVSEIKMCFFYTYLSQN